MYRIMDTVALELTKNIYMHFIFNVFNFTIHKKSV
jgi:hypothetical protein